jgi:spore coat polysaccharide biosynthesis protein SpsF (cytidylyltransferase family)
LTTIAVVQARTGSTRLPGKVLAPIGDQTLLGFMLARLSGLEVDAVVVATSTEVRDNAVVDIAEASGVAVVRGSESDVLSRFVAAMDTHAADTVIRLTADCPLMDPSVVHDVLQRHRTAGASYTSNTLVRTFPDGLDVEVAAAVALRAAATEATDPAEREHVTPFIYRRPERFVLRAALGSQLLGNERWTVDTAEDLNRIRAIVGALTDPIHASWQDILAVAGRRPPTLVGGVNLRPARRNDDELLAAVGPAHAPFAQFVEDPSIRSWIAEVASRPVGWAQVAVRGGEGRLRRWAEPGRDASLLTLVQGALRDDCQVRDLVFDR